MYNISSGLFLSVTNSGRKFGKGPIAGASASAIALGNHFKASANASSRSDAFMILTFDELGQGLRANIMVELTRFLDHHAKANEAFVIYIVAHGKYKGGLTLLAEDTEPALLRDTGIPLDWIYEVISDFCWKRDAQCLLLLDCCIESFKRKFLERIPKCVSVVIASSPLRPFTSSRSGGSLFSKGLMQILSDRELEVASTEGYIESAVIAEKFSNLDRIHPSTFLASQHGIGVPIAESELIRNSRTVANVRFRSKPLGAIAASDYFKALSIGMSKLQAAYELPDWIDDQSELMAINEATCLELIIPTKTPIDVAFGILFLFILETKDLFSELEVFESQISGSTVSAAFEKAFEFHFEEEPTDKRVINTLQLGPISLRISAAFGALHCSCRVSNSEGETTSLEPSGFYVVKEQIRRLILELSA